MSYISNLFGGGAAAGTGYSGNPAAQAATSQIVSANQDEEAKQKSFTDMLSGLVGTATGQSKALGDAYNARRMATLGGNKFITTDGGYAGVGPPTGYGTSLGASGWLLGG